MDVERILGRNHSLFDQDVAHFEDFLQDEVNKCKFLVIGGAGSIGAAVVKEIFKRDPLCLHVVDLSENNTVELVRDIRSSMGYIRGEFRTFSLDYGSVEFYAFLKQQKNYDYIFNLSALKHVRSEKDPFTLMRMIRVNIFNTVNLVKLSKHLSVKKHFCVSSDKAANPANMMGASKRIMELFLMRESEYQSISMARFANIAYSDGSILHGFEQRIRKKQPLAAPSDIARYFMTDKEAGQLCVLSGLLGEKREIFYPKLVPGFDLIKVKDITVSFIKSKGYQVYECETEDMARQKLIDLNKKGYWPVCFGTTDTSGEKAFEEFHTNEETPDYEKFKSIGVIKAKLTVTDEHLEAFEDAIAELLEKGTWSKVELFHAVKTLIPDFNHVHSDKSLDDKM